MRYKQKMLMMISLGTILAGIIAIGLFDAKGYLKKQSKKQPIKIFVSTGYSIHGYGDTIEISYNNTPSTILVADYSVEFISMDSIKKQEAKFDWFENNRLTIINLDSIKK